MENNVDIKQIDDFHMGPNWELIGIAAPTIIISLALITAITLEVNILSLILAMLGVLIMFFCIFKSYSTDKKITESYSRWLSKIPLEQLIKMRVCEELSKDSKEAITAYLNNNHKGWSFKG
ncbi:hypothetical protein A3715_36915 [Oleiphilus sp. HI0009]|nr:hypothetical protein A3715_11400 [Oleiphilus sp. HI0009]KZX80803.1 hypothetical protein A3715_36915 [Oleiphilus sp. HI0009]